MTKLNRKHGIEVGSTVKVIDGSGARFYNDKVGQTFTVASIRLSGYDLEDMVKVEGDDGPGQFAQRFELAVENGFDNGGKPLYFDDADLKPFQRVKLRDGQLAMVTVQADGQNGFTFRGNSWMPAKVTGSSRSNDGYDVMEVYAPSNHVCDALDITSCGPLLWQRADAAKARAVREADEAVAKARLVLAAAEAARAAL